MTCLATTDAEPHFHDGEMLIVHDMFRREFALMPGLVRGVAAGDRDRAQIIGDHIACPDAVAWGPLIDQHAGRGAAGDVDRGERHRIGLEGGQGPRITGDHATAHRVDRGAGGRG